MVAVSTPIFVRGGAATIGRYCSIANKVHYIGFNHPMDLSSTSPIFFENPLRKRYGFSEIDDQSKYQHLSIGNDVWIGYGALILSKCHQIGNGAIIAAGAVVTNDVPPYAIVAGVPAKIIKYRYDDDAIELIEKSQWWEKDPQELSKYDDLVNQPREWAEVIIADNEY